MGIFENGYLKSEYINPNYRGLVGWECEIDVDGDGWMFDAKFLMMNDGYCAIDEVKGHLNNGFDMLPSGHLEIPQFTPKDIPVGELCWVKGESGEWKRVVLKSVVRVLGTSKGDYKFYMEDMHYYYNVIPTIIAETEKEAEELKGWADANRL